MLSCVGIDKDSGIVVCDDLRTGKAIAERFTDDSVWQQMAAESAKRNSGVVLLKGSTVAKKTTRKTTRKTSNRWGAAEVREACKALGIHSGNYAASECNSTIRGWIAENMPKKSEPPNPSSAISGAVSSIEAKSASKGRGVLRDQATESKPVEGIVVLRDILETYSQVTELLKSAGYETPDQRIAFLEDAKRITEIATE